MGILAQVHLHRSNVKTRRYVNLSRVLGITQAYQTHRKVIGNGIIGEEVLWTAFFNVRNQSFFTDVIRRL